MNLVTLLSTTQPLPDLEMSLNFLLRLVRMLTPKVRTDRPRYAAPCRKDTPA